MGPNSQVETNQLKNLRDVSVGENRLRCFWSKTIWPTDKPLTDIWPTDIWTTDIGEYNLEI